MTTVEAPKDDDKGDDSAGMPSEEVKQVSTESQSLNSELEQLRKELETERRRSAELGIRMKYLQADLVNMQRHEDRLIIETRAQVKTTWILEIISIKEDLDRALKIVAASENSGLADGLLLIRSRIDGILKSEEIKRIDAELGATFDPNIHEAVAFQDSETQEQGKITSVISQGYTLGGKVIKPAMVEVARQKNSRNVKKSTEKTPSMHREELTIEEGANNESSQL